MSAGHQVGRELDARILQFQHARQRAQESGLAQSGNAFEQDVTSREQADEHAIHDVLLANDDLADLASNFGELGGGKFESCVRLHAIYSTSGLERAIIRAGEGEMQAACELGWVAGAGVHFQ